MDERETGKRSSPHIWRGDRASAGSFLRAAFCCRVTQDNASRELIDYGDLEEHRGKGRTNDPRNLEKRQDSAH
jgi:hypothetical protein